MKAVIQRNLDLSKVYELIGVRYESLIDGSGTTCSNCGKPISNIADISNDGNHYSVGLDCMDTILQQSQTVMSWSDSFKYNFVMKAAIQRSKSVRAKILKLQKKHGESLIVTLVEFTDCFGFNFELKCAKWGTSPLGWDYTYDNEFKAITLQYVKGLITNKRAA